MMIITNTMIKMIHQAIPTRHKPSTIQDKYNQVQLAIKKLRFLSICLYNWYFNEIMSELWLIFS